jgi:hypothetical protein
MTRLVGRKSVLWALGLTAIMLLVGCGVPNLESPECNAARTDLREFYSFHFGNEMRFSPEELQKRERFVTDDLIANWSGSVPGTDPFTTGDTDLPKAFRVAECRLDGPQKAVFNVVLFWKDDIRSEERTIRAEMVRSAERWRLNKVER